MTMSGRSGRPTSRVSLSATSSPGSRRLRSTYAPENLTASGGENDLTAAGRTGRTVRPPRTAVSPTQLHRPILRRSADQPSRPEPGQRRVGQRELGRIARSLTDRDHAVLQSLADHRFLTTIQIRDFHFLDHVSLSAAGRVCRRTLLRLKRLSVIEELGRRVGGVRAGSDAFVWRVGKLGDRLRQLETGRGVIARRKEPSERFLQHCLDIASTHLALRAADREGQLELLDTSTEPTTWRSYLGPGGEPLTLKPDLLAVTATGYYEDAWAFEIDEATESIPTLLRKCAQYEAYRATGQEQHDHGVFPIVVWIVPSEARASRLNAALDHAHRLDRTLYRVCTPNRLLEVIAGGAG